MAPPLRSTLGQLDVAVLALILEYVVDTSPASIRAVAAVNRHLNSVVQLVAHRHKKLEWDPLDGCKNDELQTWQADPQILRGLRHLTVTGKHDFPIRLSLGSPCDEPKSWTSLATFLTKIGNLQTLNWSYKGPVPLEVLRALEKHHKKAELKVFDWARFNATKDHTDPAEMALALSPALTFIRTVVWGDYYPDMRGAAFRRILASAPNLRHASIIRGSSGCVVASRSTEQILEEQQMEAEFDVHEKPNSAVRSLTLDGFPLGEEALKFWARYVDFAHLESLKCSRGLPDIYYFKHAAELLPKLKHLSLNFAYHPDDDTVAAVEHYIRTCAPLQTISLWSWRGVISLNTMLGRHGNTLEVLQLHERETVSDQPRKLLSVEEVAKIRTSCPVLRDFTMDLNRKTVRLDTQDHDSMFEELAKMPLDHLQLYYDLGLRSLAMGRSTGCLYDEDDDESSNEEDSESSESSEEEMDEEELEEDDDEYTPAQHRQKSPLAPSTNARIEPYLRDVWKAVFGSKRVGDRALDAKFGEWERKMGVGYPVAWVVQEQQQRTFWKIRPKDRDDELDDCDIELLTSLKGHS